jgi:hypothetical protein
LCELFRSADVHHHKSAEIAIFHFCSQNHKNAELVEFIFSSLPSGLEKYLELKQQFVGNYAVTAHAKLQCHRIRVALVDDSLNSSPSQQRSSAIQFSSCDIKGINVRIKRIADDKVPPLSRATSPSASRLAASSPVLSPSSFCQPILHQAVCEIDSFDFDAFVRNAASVSIQLKSAREEAHGVRFQADQLQLCTRGPINIGKLTASVQTLNASISLQDVSTAFDPFARMIQSMAYAGCTADKLIFSEERISDSCEGVSEAPTSKHFHQLQAEVVQSVWQSFQILENADVKFDGLNLDFDVTSLQDDIGAKMTIQIYPLQLDARSFSCLGLRVGVGRKQADAILLHILPSNCEVPGTSGGAMLLQPLHSAVHVECGASFLSAELSDVFIGHDVFSTFEDVSNLWTIACSIPEAVMSSISSADAKMHLAEQSSPSDAAACLRVKFVPFFTYQEAFAQPLLFTSTSAFQKRVAAHVFGNSAMVSPITGNISPATNIQDASAHILDPFSLRCFGDGSPSVILEERPLFGSPAADCTRLSYCADDMSRLCPSAGNASANAFYSGFDPQPDTRGPLVSSVRLCLGALRVTVPGRDNVATTCSFGARLDVQSTSGACSQIKVDAALDSLRVYRCRSCSNEHDIIRGVAVRLEVIPESPGAADCPSNSRIAITLQRGVKVCLGTSSDSSLNRVASDIEAIFALFQCASHPMPLSLSCVKPDTRPTSPEPHSSLVSGLLDAPPPIFGSPIRVNSKSAHHRSLGADETARSLLFGKEPVDQPHANAHVGFMTSDVTLWLVEFAKNSQLDLALFGGGNGESLIEIELASSSGISSHANMRTLQHCAVGVARVHMVAHCPGGEPFIRMSPSPLPLHAVNFSFGLPAPALSLHAAVSNFAVRLDCASSAGSSPLCPVTLCQISLYCVPRSVSSALAEASSGGSSPRASLALHVGAVSVDTSSSMALWSATKSVIESVSLGCVGSHHLRCTLKVVNRTGSSLYFFDPDRQRIDSGCFKVFQDLDASSVVPFFVADIAHSSFEPPLSLTQTGQYYSWVDCDNGFMHAAVVDVAIDTTEAQVTCTISSCISVSNLLPQPLCLIALPKDMSTARFICEVPASSSSLTLKPHFVPLHELPLPLNDSRERLERLIVVPLSIWQKYISNGGICASMLDGCQFNGTIQINKDSNLDVLAMYSCSMTQDFGPGSAGIEQQKSLSLRWSAGSDEVHAHLSVDVRQQAYSCSLLQTDSTRRRHAPTGCNVQLSRIIHIDIVVQPEVVIVNSLPHTMHVRLSPADTTGDADIADNHAPIFAGAVPSGCTVSVNSHRWQSMRISLRAASSDSQLAACPVSRSEICYIMFSERHVCRCPVLSSDCSSTFPRFCDVRVQATVVQGLQLQIALVSPGVVRNGTNLPLFVQFFSSGDASAIAGGECFLPPRPIALNTRSAVLPWWSCFGGLREVIPDGQSHSSGARDDEAANHCSKMFSPFQDSSSSSASRGVVDVSMQVDAYMSVRLGSCVFAKGERVRDVRSGEVFSFEVNGVVHDVVVDMKAVRGLGGHTVQHVSLLPSLVTTNRR